MKIKLIRCSVKGFGGPGTVVDLEKGHAEYLLHLGHAEPVEGEKEETEREENIGEKEEKQPVKKNRRNK